LPISAAFRRRSDDRPVLSVAERELIAVKLAYGLKPSAFSRLWRRRPEPGVVTYCVFPAPASAEKRNAERRAAKRQRTRLRAAKILDGCNGFLIDTAIIDRSAGGLRLRLARDQAIPNRFRLFDEESGLVLGARLVWRRQALIGACLESGGPLPLGAREIAALRGKFYAIRD
jgi:hypothetical protein